MVFYAYILHCADGSYFTGHTDNLELRIAQHQHGEVAGYTKSRRPVRLVWSQEFGERHEAMSAERQIKGWSRGKKEALIDGRWGEVSRLAQSRNQSVLRQAQDERIMMAPAIVQAMLAAAQSAHPNEACGILLGNTARLTAFTPTRNVHPDPETHFEIDPQALIDAHRAERAGGSAIAGYFHSHPSGEPVPSPTDQAQSARDGKVWAIAAGEAIRLWRDDAEGFCELSYEVVGR